MNDATLPAEETPAVTRRLAGVLVPMGLLVILADVLFWGPPLGLSVGIFFASLAVLLLASLRQRPRTRLIAICVLLLVCCAQAAIETSFSNGVALFALAAALAGEVFQPHLQSWWGRISEVLWGLATSPLRWFGLVVTSTQQAMELRPAPVNLAANAARLAWILGPAVILVVIFASIFGAGNAVFASGVANLREHFLHWLGSLDLSFPRMVFWAVTATVAIGIFHGTRAPDAPRWWTWTLRRLPRPDFKLATWQSAAVLLALNALFLAINSIDAVYLWFAKTTPGGVSYSEYVHDGVNSLTAAVVLSALVIAGLFQQEDRVVGRPWMKLFAHLWVVQNLLLIAGVFLRLRLYVDAHQLTEKRVYVACFLALVTAGFVLLAWFVQRRRTFNWLLGRNAVATCALFFVLQFCKLDAWIAQANIAQWSSRWDAKPVTAKGDKAWLDVDYLFDLGPGAWPELQRLSRDGRDLEMSKLVNDRLAQLVVGKRLRAREEPWQSWQSRRAEGRKAIGAF